MNKGSILVIDDEYGVRSGIRQILEMEGYEVQEADTGRGALGCMDRRGFDVALIDYQLPDLDGLTLLQAMKARKTDVMTCMITAYANIDTAIAATRQGIDFFLPKPFLPDDLIGVIETLLRHRRLKEDAERLRREHEASLLALASEKTQTHTLVSCLRDAVLVINREGEVVLANPAMVSLLRSAEDDLLRKPAQTVLASPEFEVVRDHLQGEDRDRKAFEVEVGDQSFMATIATFQAEDGDARGRIVTLSDISEVRRMALERSRFIRTMVHELKSPLGAIKSLIEVVSDKSLGNEIEPYLPFLGRADHRIDKLVEMIVELLSLSKIDQERQPRPAEPVSLQPLVDEVTEQLRGRMQARRIALRVDLPPELPRIPMQAEDLKTVLVNLVGNAVKYNRDDGEIRIRARQKEARIVIEVQDTGLGMKPDSVGHVFDEFFREKRKETRDIEGNGLGLAIVKRLVERANGKVEVASTLGEGSTFAITLVS